MRYVSIAKDTYLGTRQCCFLRKTGIDCFYFLIKTAKHFSQAMQAMCGQESWTTAKRDRKICNCYHYGGKTYLWVSSAMNKNRFYCCWVQNTTWHNSTTVCVCCRLQIWNRHHHWSSNHQLLLKSLHLLNQKCCLCSNHFHTHSFSDDSGVWKWLIGTFYKKTSV